MRAGALQAGHCRCCLALVEELVGGRLCEGVEHIAHVKVADESEQQPDELRIGRHAQDVPARVRRCDDEVGGHGTLDEALELQHSHWVVASGRSGSKRAATMTGRTVTGPPVEIKQALCSIHTRLPTDVYLLRSTGIQNSTSDNTPR